SREPLLGETPRAHNAGLGIGSRPGRRHLFLTDKADWTFFGRTNPMWRVRTHILCIHDKTEDGRSQRATSVSPMERFDRAREGRVLVAGLPGSVIESTSILQEVHSCEIDLSCWGC